MKTKINPTALLIFALCFAACPSLTAKAEGFIRPGALYVSYKDAGFSDKGGVSLAAGAGFGATKEHELSLEVIRAVWSWKQQFGSFVGLGFTGAGHCTPILANYRYYFGQADAQIRVYAGASAGVVLSSGDIVLALSGTMRTGSANKTKAAYGAAIGVTGKLSTKLSYDLGYRYLQSDGFDVLYASPALVAPFPGFSAHQLMLSLKFEF